MTETVNRTCPCCGSSSVRTMRLHPALRQRSVFCLDCGTSAVSVKAWNRRAALDEAEARAVKAEAERDAANALLRDGLLSVQTWRNEPIVNWAETVAAHLGAKP